jgi:Spy/CpxP family protein refolding chaperone
VAGVVLGLWLFGLAGAGEGRPPRGDGPPPRDDRRPPPQQYSIEQAVSDNAQLHTIAFSGLAFVTGDFGADTFLPPGKVCDFFGFQYMRDIDAAGKGHNPMFLDRVAGNVLKTLTGEQRQAFEQLARKQAEQFNDLARKRGPLIKAFRRELAGEVPAGSGGLNKEAVVKYVGGIFAFDAELAYVRAEAFGKLVSALTPEQKAFLAKMKFGDFNTWPEVEMDKYKLPRGTAKAVNVAYMTYASEFFSWYAGSVDADVYFCPERHGTYFGGFYMKDMPAMGKKDYDISTSVTGEGGKEFLELLTADQRRNITAIPDLQRKALKEMIEVRRGISVELRKFLKGEKADREKVLALGRRYGELDGEASWLYAAAFAKVGKTLTAEQREKLVKLRNLDGYRSPPAYIYSDAVREAPQIPSTDGFFFPPKKAEGEAQ